MVFLIGSIIWHMLISNLDLMATSAYPSPWQDKYSCLHSDKLTIIIIVPAGLLDRVTIGDRVGGRRRWKIGRNATHGYSFAVPVYRVRVEGAELWMLWDG